MQETTHYWTTARSTTLGDALVFAYKNTMKGPHSQRAILTGSKRDMVATIVVGAILVTEATIVTAPMIIKGQ
jgi:hypothetical protein